jgi:hypothetical protein
MGRRLDGRVGMGGTSADWVDGVRLGRKCGEEGKPYYQYTEYTCMQKVRSPDRIVHI